VQGRTEGLGHGFALRHHAWTVGQQLGEFRGGAMALRCGRRGRLPFASCPLEASTLVVRHAMHWNGAKMAWVSVKS
jgi:hypothetical protein